jgi:hypothetical protein
MTCFDNVPSYSPLILSRRGKVKCTFFTKPSKNDAFVKNWILA